MEIKIATEDSFSDVIKFYHAINGEENTVIQATEQVVVACSDHLIIGAVRVCRESGVLVLRTLYVLPQYRGLGTATKILKKVKEIIDNDECYCLPYPHVRSFYGRIGFVEIEYVDLPTFLQKRYTEYNQSFRVIAMKKVDR